MHEKLRGQTTNLPEEHLLRDAREPTKSNAKQHKLGLPVALNNRLVAVLT